MNRKKAVLFLCKLISLSTNNNISNEEENKGMNIPDILGRTPLHQAAAKGDQDIIKYLIKFGANVNSKTISGETPLMKAIAFYQTEGAKLLYFFYLKNYEE
jgi:ankyrin repeat protein